MFDYSILTYDLLKELAEKCYTIGDVADKFDCSYKCVRDIILKKFPDLYLTYSANGKNRAKANRKSIHDLYYSYLKSKKR